MADQLTLGYWNLRGLCHSVRLLLKHANAEYKEIFYEEPTDGNFLSAEWFKVKPTIEVDFPNLPYLFDGDIKMTQSLAILRHLGRKFNLAPKTPAEQARSDVLEMEVLDWRNDGYKLWYGPSENFEKDRPEYETRTKNRMVQLSKFMGSGPYVLGDKVTYIDFMLYEFLDNQRRFIKGLLAPHANLENFVKKIESLPKVKEYLESDEYKNINYICASMAHFGNRRIPNHYEV